MSHLDFLQVTMVPEKILKLHLLILKTLISRGIETKRFLLWNHKHRVKIQLNIDLTPLCQG